MADLASLQRATESTDAPTPGYLYQDIAKSVASSPVANAETVTYLCKRLTSKANHNVKYKSLKVIQMVAQNAITRGQFKRVVCQDLTCVTAIKECLNYRGPPDPVHGDEIYSRVRNQAKETLDAIYSDTPSSEQVPYNNNISNSNGSTLSTNGSYSTGFGMGGSNNPVNPGLPPSVTMATAGPRKMDGIGNPMFKDPRQQQQQQYKQPHDLGTMTIGDVLTAAKDGFMGIIKGQSDLGRNNAGGGGGGVYSFGGANNQWTGASPPPGAHELATSTQGQWTMASNRGPNAYGSATSSNYSNGTTASSVPVHGVGGSWGTMSAAAPTTIQSNYMNTGGVISGPGGAAISNGSYERNLIMELCPPGGITAEPPADKLQQFIPIIPSLNPDFVCPALLDALEEGQPWIIRAKALWVMETVIKVTEQSRSAAQNNPYADFFHTCKDEIEPLAHHNRMAIRDPARRVLQAMGIEVQEQHNSLKSTVQSLVPSMEPPANLLDFDSTPPVDSSSNSILDSTPPAAPSSTDKGMFGGMTVKPTPISTISTSAPIADLLGSGTPNAESVEAVLESSPLSGSIGDVSIRTSANATSSSASENKEPISSSAFSFIDSADASASKPTKESSVRDSFDPLLSLGITTNGSSSAAQKPIMTSSSSMMPAFQHQQQQMMQMQMNLMQINSSSSIPSAPVKSTSITMNSNPSLMSSSVMGGSKGGVATSFAFFEDPAKTMKLAQEAKAKKFDFVQDAMKEAKN